MMNSVTDTVTVNILGREFKIKCPKDKVAELKKAASYLNDKMQEVHHGNKLITIDRVAVTAALNIAHELILTKQQSQLDDRNLSIRLNKLRQTLANAK
ncbi:MAG: cell division protein ZapA [bacterium]